MKQIFCEDHRRQHEKVFHPLPRTHGLQETDEHQDGAGGYRRARTVSTYSLSPTVVFGLVCVATVFGLRHLARAQHTTREWSAVHLREARAQARQPRGMLPLLRLGALREHADPLALVDAVHSLAIDGAIPPLRRALAARLEADLRRDLGQSSEASAIVASQNFITRWLIVGPFDNEGHTGFSHELPPETHRGERPDPTEDFQGTERTVHWRVMPDVSVMGQVALDAAVRPATNACAFAQTTVTAGRVTPAVLWLGASGAIAAWVNGDLVVRDSVVRRASADRAGARVRLRAGANRVLLKVCTDTRGMGFFARFTTPAGTPLSGLTVDPEPSAAQRQTLRTTPSPLPPVLGDLDALRVAAERPNANAMALEDYARALALTRSDDPAAPIAADLAERAARAHPTALGWLLVAELVTDYNRRTAALDRAYALAPRDPRVLVALAHHRRTGVWPEESLPYLSAAERADPGYVLPGVERALLYDTVGLPVAAHAALELLTVQAPRSPSLLRVRAQTAARSRQTDLARSLRLALARVRDTDVDNWLALARDARERGDRDQVTTIAERVLSLAPSRLSVYPAAAELFESAGDGARADAVLATAVQLAPDEPTLWSARGELQARLGHTDQARAALRRALILRPQDRTVRRHLESLEPSTPRVDESLADSSEMLLSRRGHASEGDAYNIRSLTELTVRTVFDNGLSATFRQVAYEVHNAQGARDGRTYTAQYDPDTQRFELRAARVYRADGAIVDASQVDEFSVTSDPSMRMYFNNRVVQVTFTNLEPGDVVELRWRVDDVSARNVFADYFGDLELVQAAVPRARWRYVLRAPSARRFFVHAQPLSDGRAPTLEESTTDGVTSRSWAVDAAPAVPPEEHAPGLTERGGYLHVSTYSDWASVGRWYWGLVRDQLVADDRLRATVRELTAGLSDDRAKVRAVYHWVIEHTRYVALEFGIHGFKPYAVTQVCTRGFGDCKDKASLIVAMLREAGVDASLVLLRTRARGDIALSPASLAVFDHAIAYVPSLDLFLDGTAQHSGMNELPGGDQGAMALIVNQRGEARIVTTPVYGPDRNTTTVRSVVTVTATGSATVQSTQAVQGPGAAGLRSRFEAPATRAERVEDDLRDFYPGTHVTRVTVGDLDDLEIPARVEYTASVPAFGVLQGGAMSVRLVNPVNLTRRYAPRSTRTADVIVGVPSRYDETREVRLPPGASVTDLPPAVELDGPFGRFEYHVENHQNSLQIRRVLTLLRDRVTPAQYPAWRQFCQSVDQALERRVTVRLESSR